MNPKNILKEAKDPVPRINTTYFYESIVDESGIKIKDDKTWFI